MKALIPVLFVLIAQGVTAEEPKPWVELAVTTVFQPAMHGLNKSTMNLAELLADSCESSAGRAAFLDVVEDFSAIEYYRLGAMNQANRAERLFFWPDRKGTGQKQMRRLLARADRASLDATTLAKKSVALQGLPALERILFANHPEISAPDCAVARAIANNMSNITAELERDWSDGQGVAHRLINPSVDSVYRTDKESLSALLTIAESALTSMKDKKLKALSKGLELQGQLPKSLPFSRSGQTFNNLRINLQSVNRLLVDSGVAESADVQSSIAFEFQNAENMVNALEQSLADENIEESLQQLAALGFIFESLNSLVTDNVAVKLGVVTGFNSSDGD